MRNKQGTQHQRVLQALKEYKEPIGAQDLSILLGLKIVRIQASISALIKANQPIVKHKTAHSKKVKYQYGTATVQFTPFAKTNGEAAYKTCNKPNPLVERCYHLIHAAPSISSGRVADFFNLTDEEARALLTRTAHTYKNIKLTIHAEVQDENI